MRFYAQRGEDEKLFKLLHMDERVTPGFYIDVGAWHPVDDSVTLAFYRRGWHGINIEPSPFYFKMLDHERTLDKNLQIALSDAPGRGIIHTFEGSGLSTFSQEYADNVHRMSRAFPRSTAEVEIQTLAQVCERHVPIGQHIDFLKIDVEGWEHKVLRGADFNRWRPEIVVIEAIKPLYDTPDWDSWDHILIDARYSFLEFDGLNRWYKDSTIWPTGRCVP